MKDFEALSFDDQDEVVNPKPEDNDFDRIVSMALSRRELFKGVVAVGGIAALGDHFFNQPAMAADSRFAFSPITTNSLDDITVPDGYSAQVVTRWGDPLWSDAPDFDHATRGTAESQTKSFGDNIDGMEVYAHGDRMILVANNEYTNRGVMWGNREEGKFETRRRYHERKSRSWCHGG